MLFRSNPITLSYSIFQFDALMRRPNVYGRWMFERIARDWGYMLRSGATAFWETIRGEEDFDGAGSLCHGWSAVPIYCYFAYGLGLRPAAPGFGEYSVRPVRGGPSGMNGRVLRSDGSVIDL